MKSFSKAFSISQHLVDLQRQGKTIGFVPTMGALHDGHIGLIEKAKNECDEVVCSIFVNPLQFNRAEDLKSYPDRLLQDSKMLERANCDILFTPSVEEIYQKQPDLKFNFGTIGKGMEAEFRPGHFEGVAAVINRFLEILHPNKAYFGEKDYQQLAIVRWLVKENNFETEIVPCETIRFENGLAMSSRNYLLEKDQFSVAAEIYQTLLYCKVNAEFHEPEQLAKKCLLKLKRNFSPEYFVIADENTMEPLKKWTDSKCPRAFVSAYLSTVRLIDNLSLNN